MILVTDEGPTGGPPGGPPAAASTVLDDRERFEKYKLFVFHCEQAQKLSGELGDPFLGYMMQMGIESARAEMTKSKTFKSLAKKR